jgi:hypothetical protein
MKDNYSGLLIASVLLVAISQALEGLNTPVASFLHGFLIGLSIVCSVVGLVAYSRSAGKG